MNYIKILIFLNWFLCLSLASHGQWNKLESPTGYNYYSSYVDKQGNLFIENNDSIYYSNNLGNTWFNVGPFTILSNLSDLTETDNSEIYSIRTNEKFNKLTKKFDLLPYPADKLFKIDKSNTLWYFDDYGYKVSNDSAKTFEYIKINVYVNNCYNTSVASYKDEYKIISEYCNSKTLFKYDANGVKQLTNSPQNPGRLYINQLTGTIILWADYKLYRSTDKGESFEKINIGYVPYGDFAGYDNGRITFQGDGFYYSDDDGINWIDLSIEYESGPQINTTTYFRGGFVNSSDTLVILNGSCTKQGVFKSYDKGKNWTLLSNNFYLPKINSIIDDKNGNVYINSCSDTSVLVSNNNGKTWNPLQIYFENNYIRITQVAINRSGYIYAISFNNIFKSTDGGNVYKKLENFPLKQYIGGGKIYLANDKYLCFNSGNLTCFSEDDGETWVLRELNFNFVDKVLYDEDGQIYYIRSGILTKYHHSMSYPFMFYQPDMFKFTLAPNGNIYFIKYDGTIPELYVSTNKMQTYQNLGNYFKGSMEELFCDDNNYLYVYNYFDIYLSKDNGNSLKLFGKTPNDIGARKLFNSSNNTLFSIGNNSAYSFDTKLSSRTVLSGHTYKDSIQNCFYDIPEQKMASQIIAEGLNNQTTYSDKNGNYKLRLQEGNYQISIKEPNDLWESCPKLNINIPNASGSISLDLGLKIKSYCPYVSVNIYQPIMRRCFNNLMYITYCNEGTKDAKKILLKLTLDSNLEYISSDNIPVSQNNQEIVFFIHELKTGECGQIIVTAKLSCNAAIGDEICSSAAINPIDLCTSGLPQISTTTKCDIATGSYDPNDKIAYINNKLAKGITEKNQDIEYIIRFQNTGNDTAFRVVIIDNIPLGLNINTIKPTSSSHAYSFEMDERRVKFIFDPIMLPDSNINEPESHGFIAFRISPEKDLPYGTKLDNYADIYFDFNEAVTTNTAYLTVIQATSTTSLNNNLEFNYYPNPTKSELNIQLPQFKPQIYTLKITDVLGKELLKESWKGSSYKLNLTSSIKSGIYFIHVEDEEGSIGHGKFVVE